MSEDLPIRVRAANEEDIPFIFNSWLKSYRNSLFTKDIPPTVYYSEHHKVLERLLRTSLVLIACNQDKPEQIYGYIVCGTIQNVNVVHYTYTKQPFRNLGIAKLLFKTFSEDKDTAGFYSHSTRVGRDLAIKANLVYSPYLGLIYDMDPLKNSEPSEDAKK